MDPKIRDPSVRGRLRWAASPRRGKEEGGVEGTAMFGPPREGGMGRAGETRHTPRCPSPTRGRGSALAVRAIELAGMGVPRSRSCQAWRPRRPRRRHDGGGPNGRRGGAAPKCRSSRPIARGGRKARRGYGVARNSRDERRHDRRVLPKGVRMPRQRGQAERGALGPKGQRRFDRCVPLWDQQQPERPTRIVKRAHAATHEVAGFRCSERTSEHNLRRSISPRIVRRPPHPRSHNAQPTASRRLRSASSGIGSRSPSCAGVSHVTRNLNTPR